VGVGHRRRIGQVLKSECKLGLCFCYLVEMRTEEFLEPCV
jgi:hypothetical protein